MAAKIKLQRKGKKGQPKYRFVVQEAKSKLSGNVIDILGEYDPLKEPSFFNINKEKAEYWLKKGAIPTEKVRDLLGKANILPPVDTSKLHKRKPKKEPQATEAPGETKPAEGTSKKEDPSKDSEQKSV